jgi:hypothetical protein
MARLIVVATITLFLFSSIATAQVGASKEDVENLKKEVSILELKLQLLDERLKRMNAELENVRRELRNRPTVARNGSKDPVKNGTKPKDPIKPKGPEKFPKPKQPRTYVSATDILRDVPADMRPKSGTWNSATVKRVKNWLKQVPVGQKFEAELTLARNPSTQKNRKSFLKKEFDKQWEATFDFNTVASDQWGIKFNQKIFDAWPDQIKIFGNDEFLKRVQKLKAGDRIRISGVIGAVRLGLLIRKSHDLILELKDYKVTSKILDGN